MLQATPPRPRPARRLHRAHRPRLSARHHRHRPGAVSRPGQRQPDRARTAQVVGSALIGQAFTGDQLFPRPARRRPATATTPPPPAARTSARPAPTLIERVKADADSAQADRTRTRRSRSTWSPPPAAGSIRTSRPRPPTSRSPRVAKARGIAEATVRDARRPAHRGPRTRLPRRAAGQRAGAQPGARRGDCALTSRRRSLTCRGLRRVHRCKRQMPDDIREQRRPAFARRAARDRRSAKARGRLKIFLGAAPGVGKTYEMLMSGRARAGATASTSSSASSRPTAARRPQALLAGFEVIPRKAIDYKGRMLEEMDLDAILARRPAAGAGRRTGPHQRARQPPSQALSGRRGAAGAGIDVYTTLNIQHVESLNDVVAQITRIRVRETVPDCILDRADDIELIDLTPDDLIQRLKEGKVYVPKHGATRASSTTSRPAT